MTDPRAPYFFHYSRYYQHASKECDTLIEAIRYWANGEKEDAFSGSFILDTNGAFALTKEDFRALSYEERFDPVDVLPRAVNDPRPLGASTRERLAVYGMTTEGADA